MEDGHRRRLVHNHRRLPPPLRARAAAATDSVAGASAATAMAWAMWREKGIWLCAAPARASDTILAVPAATATESVPAATANVTTRG